MAGFEEILQSLHNNATLQDEEQSVIVGLDRTITVPQGYNTLLGYAGDVNSQIVTFQLPLKHKGHQLSNCNYKKIKWKNFGNGAEGHSNLNVLSESSEYWLASWEVPPELMIAAGSVEIAISIYDVNELSNKIIFAWNSAPFKGFSVGESFVNLGEEWQGDKLPAKNEILNVNIEQRNIVAPVGYNSVIANYGDVGTSKVFFVINKYVRGMNILTGPAMVNINYSLGGIVTQGSDTITTKNLFETDEDRKSDKVLLTWDVPAKITKNEGNYVGSIKISVEVYEKDENGNIIKRWVSSNFDNLILGSSLLQEDIISLAERNEQVVREIVEEQIDEYVDNTYFITTS